MIHEGRFPEAQEAHVLTRLANVIRLIGGLWRDLGAAQPGQFANYEMARLAGTDPRWEEEADVLSLVATQYCGIDNAKAFAMANRAFEVAVRGLADLWGLRSDESVSLREVMKAMESVDDDRAHPSLFNDWTRTGYQYTEFGADHIAWFFPPMSLVQVRSASHDEWDDLRAAMNYTHLVRDVVLSYPERSPADPASGRQRSRSDEAPE